MTELPIETDLPLAFLAGRRRRIQPDHHSPLARLGITGTRGHRIGDRVRHVMNTAGYGTEYRVQAAAIRPGWTWGDAHGALAWHVYCIAVSEAMAAGIDDPAGSSDGELDQATHDFAPAVLVVNGAGYPGWELRERGVLVRAAVVDGWTILASVLDGDEPLVELEYLTDSETSA